MSRYEMLDFATHRIRTHKVERSIREKVIAELAARYPAVDMEIAPFPWTGRAPQPGWDTGGARSTKEPVARLDLGEGTFFACDAFEADCLLDELRKLPDRGGWRKLHSHYTCECLSEADYQAVVAWLERDAEKLVAEGEAYFDGLRSHRTRFLAFTDEDA